MGGALLDFLLGAAVIALPQHQVILRHHIMQALSESIAYAVCCGPSIHEAGAWHMQVPVAIGSASIGLVRHLVRKKKQRKSSRSSREGDEAGQKQVTLEWDSISCTLTTKKGGTKNILQNVSGEAKPGKLLAIMGPSGVATSLSVLCS